MAVTGYTRGSCTIDTEASIAQQASKVYPVTTVVCSLLISGLYYTSLYWPIPQRYGITALIGSYTMASNGHIAELEALLWSTLYKHLVVPVMTPCGIVQVWFTV